MAKCRDTRQKSKEPHYGYTSPTPIGENPPRFPSNLKPRRCRTPHVRGPAASETSLRSGFESRTWVYRLYHGGLIKPMDATAFRPSSLLFPHPHRHRSQAWFPHPPSLVLHFTLLGKIRARALFLLFIHSLGAPARAQQVGVRDGGVGGPLGAPVRPSYIKTGALLDWQGHDVAVRSNPGFPQKARGGKGLCPY